MVVYIPSVMAAWYVSLFLATRIIRPTLMIRNMRSTQNINICYGSGVPVPLTQQPPLLPRLCDEGSQSPLRQGFEDDEYAAKTVWRR